MLQGNNSAGDKQKRRRWRKGYTTGSCAAAAAKGAVMMLTNAASYDAVTIDTPAKVRLNIKLYDQQVQGDVARCSVIKDAGDDPDITDGIKVFAEASWLESQEIEIVAGEGIGKVTKPGLDVAVGEPAINPVPRRMIYNEVSAVLPRNRGVSIRLWVPGGEKLAEKTLNPQLGIEGGISILGTTGIVEPMSEEAFKTSLVPQIKVALAQGEDTLVLTPGRRGQRRAVSLGVPEAATVQVSNFIGYMLEQCVDLGVKRVILFGHLGKLVKIAAGVFHTHSKVADARKETLIAQAALEGVPYGIIGQLADCVTTEAAIGVLRENGLDHILHRLAAKASQRAEQRVQQRLRVGTIFLSLKGEIVGYDKAAIAIGSDKGWFTQLR